MTAMMEFILREDEMSKKLIFYCQVVKLLSWTFKAITFFVTNKEINITRIT